jgi:hypothetical protein
MTATTEHRYPSAVLQTWVLPLLLMMGCAGSPLPPAEANAPPASNAPTITPSAPSAPSAWSVDMPKEQKSAFMKANVVPNMKPVFQSANPTRYGDFGCKTCHGPEYKDPHEYLPKLTMKDGKITAFAEKPELAKFMAENVVPKMASAMGMPPFDPKTGRGFGCQSCHPIDQK